MQEAAQALPTTSTVALGVTQTKPVESPPKLRVAVLPGSGGTAVKAKPCTLEGRDASDLVLTRLRGQARVDSATKPRIRPVSGTTPRHPMVRMLRIPTTSDAVRLACPCAEVESKVWSARAGWSALG